MDIETPLINQNDIPPLTPEQELWAQQEALTNEIVDKLYRFYKRSSAGVFSKLYHALLTRLSTIADNIADNSMTDAKMIDFISKGDKIPKMVESFRLLSEGKGYEKISDINTSTEQPKTIDIVDLVVQREKNK